MVECPRCGNQAEYLSGEAFVLVWCDFCLDIIEVGGLDLHPDVHARKLADQGQPVGV
ncbi:MAG TPA: hypothetical protein VFA46_16200 [Actinomycetes bacterium]|jgi:hypothetical protein|nr:hypothetical protein [Actinomycetes bacterium]